MNRIEDITRRAVTPFLEENACILWDVVFEKEGAYTYLRVLFDAKSDNSDGVAPLDLDKCEKLTLPLNKLIDELEFMKKSPIDIVEVGSPGITRRLRHAEHFERCTGKQVRVLRRLENGKTESTAGELTGYNAQDKIITLGEEEIPLKKALRINLEEQTQ
ncbi:MAG: ribosome assembly cofactor RimP [Oscillospiraceae bacterium]|nr:ribosome assembly cofactor RimP [Oscillospiraceae bacterium]